LRQQVAQVFVEAQASVTAPHAVVPLYVAVGRLQMNNAPLKKVAQMSITQQRLLVQATEPASS
jgi:hypothetical protein